MSPEIVTQSGVVVPLLYPERVDIRADDLMVHLDRICRYGGAIKWSVLQHSALCAMMGAAESPTVGAYAAIHDLHEAYIGDLMSPMKRASGISSLEEFRDFEDSWARRVRRHFGLPDPDLETELAVKRIDTRALTLETWAAGAPSSLSQHPLIGGPPLSAEERQMAEKAKRSGPARLWRIVIDTIKAGGGRV